MPSVSDREDLAALSWEEIPSRNLPEVLSGLRFYRARISCASSDGGGWLVLSQLQNKAEYSLTFVMDSFGNWGKPYISVD